MDLSVVNEDALAALVLAHAQGKLPGPGPGPSGGGADGATRGEGGGGGGSRGAVLVFLPGVAEIESAVVRLAGCAGLHVVRLHSQLTTAEQRAAFAPPPRGLCKVALRSAQG